MLRASVLPVLAGVLAVCCLHSVQAQSGSCRNPIIIIPGIASSDLLGEYSGQRSLTGRTVNSEDDPHQAAGTHKRTSRKGTAPAPGVSPDQDHKTPESGELQAMLISNSTTGIKLSKDKRDELKKIMKVLVDHAKKKQKKGAGASQITAPCPVTPPRLMFWLPLDTRFLLFPECFFYLMMLKYDKAADRFTDNTNAAVDADSGGSSGTSYTLFRELGYDELAAYLVDEFGYTIGRDLIATPYDWRKDLTTLNQDFDLDSITRRITAAVRANCGKKAILIGHSLGSLVTLQILREARFADWKEANVLSHISLAAPLAGAVPAVNVRTSGNGFLLPDNPLFTLLGPAIPFLVYPAFMGLPSPVLLFPYASAFGADSVVARTPRRTYKITELDELLADIGDEQAVDIYERVRTLDSLVPSSGGDPGVPTYCIYGTTVDTPKSYRFRADIRPGVKSAAPVVVDMGAGDGLVNLESLRFCSRITRDDRITELDDGTDHWTVLTALAAQAALGRVLRRLLT